MALLVACLHSNPEVTGSNPAKEASSPVVGTDCLHVQTPGGTLNTVAHVQDFTH